jgi:hypothetical protein
MLPDAGHLLTNLSGEPTDRVNTADQIAEMIRDKIPPMYGPATIFHAPAVIAALWNKELVILKLPTTIANYLPNSYATICKDLDAEHLAHHDVTKHVVKVSYDDDLYTYGVYLEKGCPVHGGQHSNMTSSHSSSHIRANGTEDLRAQQSLDGISFRTSFTGSQEIDPLGIFDNFVGNTDPMDTLDDGSGDVSLGNIGILPFDTDSIWGLLDYVPENSQLLI